MARVYDAASRVFQALWQELHQLGDAEGQNLIVDLYSGEGQPAGFADLARRVVKDKARAELYRRPAGEKPPLPHQDAKVAKLGPPRMPRAEALAWRAVG